jgi:transcriptional regulator with XRE-family HTH domain
MVIADRLRALRTGKNLSQGDLEKRTGLMRFYISRVENGHTVPSVETLEKFARALEVPLYYLFYEGEEPPTRPDLPERRIARDLLWGISGKEARLLSRLRHHLGAMSESDRSLLLSVAQRMATLQHTRSR